MTGKTVNCAICGERAVVKDLCEKHYQRLWRNGHFELKRPADWGQRSKHPLWERWKNLPKRADGLGRAKEWDDFWRFVSDVSPVPETKAALVSLRSAEAIGPGNFAWKEVWSDKYDRNFREDRNAYMREWNARNPAKARQNRMRRYKLTIAQYEEKLMAQDGKCLICFREPPAGTRLYVDHDHGPSKQTRDLLCRECNSALGQLGDDPEVVHRAYLYLLRWKERAA